MKTQIDSLKKAASLSCFLILFFFNTALHAQIVYTDIPDATPNATYSLDLNNDAIVDFLIQFDAGDKLVCKPQNNNAYSGNIIAGEYLPWAFSASNNICESLPTWFDANNPGTMASGTSLGYWVGETDKYLALKLVVGANTYYGWLRLDLLATSTSFTIKDYAYESTPGACIQTGQTILGLNKNLSKKTISVFPNPFNSSTTIRTNGNFNNTSLTIYNSFGQSLKQINNISGQTFTLTRDSLPKGMYYVRLIEENKIIAVEKLVITD